MKDRRSMSTALQTVDLPPEAADFLRQGTPKPKTVSALPESSIPVSVDENQENVEIRPKLNRVERTSNVPKEKQPPEPIVPARLVSLTVRVPAEIPDNLLRASVDRKLKRQRPSTQQEIAAEAIVQWLHENGY